MKHFALTDRKNIEYKWILTLHMNGDVYSWEYPDRITLDADLRELSWILNVEL